MPYCPACGVEVAESASACPLCGGPLVKDKPSMDGMSGTHSGKIEGVPEAKPSEYNQVTSLSVHQRKMMVAEMISVSLGIAGVAIALINIVQSGKITWAIIPVESIIYAIFSIVPDIFLGRKPLLLLPILFVLTIGFLCLVDLADGRLTWFLGYALPLTLVTVLAVSFTWVCIHFSKKKGLNIVAFILLGTDLLALAVNGVVQFNLGLHPLLTWSAIVSLAVIPVAVFFLYLHYRIIRNIDIKKLFKL